MATMRKSSRVIKPVIIWDPSDPGAPVIQVTDESNIKIESTDSIIESTNSISIIEADTNTEIDNSTHDAHETSQNNQDITKCSEENIIPIDSPWNISSVQDLEQFLHYSCPQCSVKTKTIEKFIQHAIGNDIISI